MRNLVIPVLILLTACASPRRGLDPARLPAQFEVELEREIRADFNEDEVEDSVKLLPPREGQNYHALEITLSRGNSVEKIVNQTLVYAFANPGASLELLDNGSFKILIDHTGAGRSSSLREYTISYRHKKFVVSGVTVSEFDRVDPHLGGSCDMNLLTGKGERNSRPVKMKPVQLDLLSAHFDWLPKDCRF